jgi:hypothetical protein
VGELYTSSRCLWGVEGASERYSGFGSESRIAHIGFLCSGPITSPIIPGESGAPPLEKFCNHWHQGRRGHRCYHFGQEGVWTYGGGIHARLILCLWCGPKGVPL